MTDRRWVFHPFLVAAFPVLLLYSRNVHAVPWTHALAPMALTLGATALVFEGLRRSWRDAAKAGLVTSIAAVGFFSFGRIVRFAARLGFVGHPDVRDWSILAAEGAAIAGLVAFIRSRKSIPKGITDACNAGSVALVAFSAFALFGELRSGDDLPEARKPLETRIVATKSPRRPDIYFLVLDAYGRSDVLKEYYGFDNSAFLDRLERKGFRVARRSTSNYCQTALSISATLDARYHDDLAGRRSEDRLPLKHRLADGTVLRTLKAQGYRVAAFPTGFHVTNLSDADLYMATPGGLLEFHELLADTTPTWLLMGRRAAHEPLRLHRDRVLNVFDRMPDVARVIGPTFCLAHVVSPHPPFLFGKEGEDTSGLERSYSMADGLAWRSVDDHGDAYVARYRDQVAYITRRAEETIDLILATSPEPPIIIVQGDHGPGSRYETDSPRPNDLRERMGILNACYLPDGGGSLIDDAITPVNTFRVVLDRYLGTRLGRLDDRNYYSPYDTPYLFTDVTDQVRREP